MSGRKLYGRQALDCRMEFRLTESENALLRDIAYLQNRACSTVLRDALAQYAEVIPHRDLDYAQAKRTAAEALENR
jgi:hypothetical protein